MGRFRFFSMKKHRTADAVSEAAPEEDAQSKSFADRIDEASEDVAVEHHDNDQEGNFSDDSLDENYQASFDGGTTVVQKTGPAPVVWWPRSPICWLAILIIILELLAFNYFWYGVRARDYNAFRFWVCQNVLRDDCGSDRVVILSQEGDPVLADQSILSDWNENVRPATFLENKFRSLSIGYSVMGGNSTLNTGNNLLGLYERDALERSIEAGTHFLLAGAAGDFDARELFEDLDLNQADRAEAQRYLEEILKLNGAEGYFRLGQLYLGSDAIVPSPNGQYPQNPPKFISHAEYFPNNFLADASEYSIAYRHMFVAVQCNWPGSYEWLNYIAQAGQLGGRVQSLNREGQDEINDRLNLIDGGLEAFCKGETLRYRVQQLRDPAVIWRFLSDRRPWPTFLELIEKLQLPEPEFLQWIGLLKTEAIEQYGYEGESRYYGRPRDNSFLRSPGRGAGSIFDSGRRLGSEEGIPDECKNLAPGEECQATAARREASARCEERALTAYNSGRALINSNPDDARANLEIAMLTGEECQAEGSRRAATLMQRLNMTCTYSQQSLARISRNAENNPEGGAVISLRARQSALAAMRYYNYKIDGKYGQQTRDAVSSFQREFGFVDSGALTPEETVHLFCIAGIQRGDVRSEHTLGLMYVTGLGVIRDLEAGIRHLENTSSFGYAASTYNLALIFGTGTVEASYNLCDVPENLQRADSYLEEAANAGHPGAIRLIRDFGALQVSDRWEKIKERLELNDFHKARMLTVGEGCRPN